MGNQRFWSQVGVLAGSAVVGQTLLLISSPLISRIYTPHDMGVFALYTAIISIGAAFICGRYESAIPLPREDERASDLMTLSIVIACGISLVAAASVTIIAPGLAGTPLANLRPYLFFVPIGLLAAGTYQSLSFWAIRKRQFSAIGQSRVAQGVTGAVLPPALGLLIGGPLGLLLGQVSSQAGAVSILIFNRTGSTASTLMRSWRRILSVAVEYWRLPLISVWSAMLNAISVAAPVFIISHLFGVAVAGMYGFSLRVLQAPLMIISQALGQVFLSDAAEHWRAGTLSQEVRLMVGRLAPIALGLLTPIVVAGPELFAIAFGENWRGAGLYSQLLVPWLFFVVIGSPLSVLANALNKQAFELVFQGTLLAMRGISLFIGGLIGGPSGALIIFSIASAVWWCGYIFGMARFAGLSARTLLSEIPVYAVAIAALSSLVGFAARAIVPHRPDFLLIILSLAAMSCILAPVFHKEYDEWRNRSG